MAVTLVGTVLSNCDANTNWGGVTTISTESQLEGTGCLSEKVSNATQEAFYTPASSLNFTSPAGAYRDHSIYIWLNCTTPTLDTEANGGLRVRAGDDTDYWDFFVGGEDNKKSGWGCYCIRPGDAGSIDETGGAGAGSWSAISAVGGVIKTITSISGNFDNALWDQLTLGQALDWTGSGGTMQDFLDSDEGNNWWGMIRSTAGGKVFVPQCKLYIGYNSSGTFSIDGDIVVFDDARVGNAFYEISTWTSGSSLTIDDAIIQTAGSAKWSIYMINGTYIQINNSILKNTNFITMGGTASNDSYINNTVINGCTVIRPAEWIYFDITNCDITYQTVGSYILSDALYTNYAFISGSLVSSNSELESTMNILDGCSFHNLGDNYHLIDFAENFAMTTRTWNWNVVTTGASTSTGFATTNGSTGNETIRVNVAAGNTLTINVAAGATVPSVYNTGSGSVVVNVGAVPVTIKAVTLSGTPIQGARVYVAEVGTLTELYNDVTDSNGEITFNYSYTADQLIFGRVRQGSTTPFYKTNSFNGTISSTGFTYTAIMILDE